MSTALLDPDNISGDKFQDLNEKIKVAKILISKSPPKKGFPFVFVFSASKSHLLKEIKLPIYTDENGNTEYFYTAATDGKNYYWSPQLIERLTPAELSIIMCHETYHVILQHCDQNRTLGKNKKIWNIAVDYVVNGMIEHDARLAWQGLSVHDNYRGKKHPIWSGNLGSPMYFDELINSIKASTKAIKGERKASKKTQTQTGQPNTTSPQVANPPVQPSNQTPSVQKSKQRPSMKDLKFYADYCLYGKSAEEIYDEIMKHFDEMQNEQIDQILEEAGMNLDDHPDLNVNRQTLLREILEAAETAKSMGVGNLPQGIRDQLTKLSEPKFSWQDIVRSCLSKRRHEKGSINDWSRFKRRGIALNLFQPKKKDDFVSWCAFLDTSGSMSNEDMAYAISQLKCLDGRAEGIIVPNDAQPYWDQATNVKNINALSATKIIGRGGTAFGQIFSEFRSKLKKQFDVLIILTDGGIFDMNELKNPGIDVVWILTNNSQFKPPFGRVCKFRAY